MTDSPPPYSTPDQLLAAWRQDDRPAVYNDRETGKTLSVAADIVSRGQIDPDHYRVLETMIAESPDPKTLVQPPLPSKKQPLLYAVDSAIFERLRAAGAEVDYRDDEEQTLLHAAVQTATPTTVDLLLRAGIEPDVRDRANRTPLMAAAEADDRPETTAIIDRLLAAGADLDAIDDDEETTVFRAAEKSSRGVRKSLRHLLFLGASITATNEAGEQPFHRLTFKMSQTPTDELITSIEFQSLLERFIELGFDPNSVSTDGHTMVFDLAQLANPVYLEIATELGLDPLHRNIDYIGAFEAAVVWPESPRGAVVDWLLDHGLDCARSSVDEKGVWTSPLEHALEMMLPVKMIRKILENGGDAVLQSPNRVITRMLNRGGLEDETVDADTLDYLRLLVEFGAKIGVDELQAVIWSTPMNGARCAHYLLAIAEPTEEAKRVVCGWLDLVAGFPRLPAGAELIAEVARLGARVHTIDPPEGTAGWRSMLDRILHRWLDPSWYRVDVETFMSDLKSHPDPGRWFWNERVLAELFQSPPPDRPARVGELIEVLVMATHQQISDLDELERWIDVEVAAGGVIHPGAAIEQLSTEQWERWIPRMVENHRTAGVEFPALRRIYSADRLDGYRRLRPYVELTDLTADRFITKPEIWWTVVEEQEVPPTDWPVFQAVVKDRLALAEEMVARGGQLIAPSDAFNELFKWPSETLVERATWLLDRGVSGRLSGTVFLSHLAESKMAELAPVYDQPGGIELLQKLRLNPNPRNWVGMVDQHPAGFMLQRVASQNDLGAVATLLLLGADADYIDENGDSATSFCTDSEVRALIWSHRHGVFSRPGYPQPNCVICLRGRPTVSFDECHHTTLCAGCADSYPEELRTCPICRRSFSSLVYL